MEPQDLPYLCETLDPRHTMGVAAEFSKLVEPGQIVLLSGPLGAGKTQFVRGFCEGLGFQELWEVNSPTYTVVNHYEVGSGVDHLDLYRFEGVQDLEEIDLDDMLAAPTIKLIEWPERLAHYPVEPHFLVKITVLSEHNRQLAISRLGAR